MGFCQSPERPGTALARVRRDLYCRCPAQRRGYSLNRMTDPSSMHSARRLRLPGRWLTELAKNESSSAVHTFGGVQRLDNINPELRGRRHSPSNLQHSPPPAKWDQDKLSRPCFHTCAPPELALHGGRCPSQSSCTDCRFGCLMCVRTLSTPRALSSTSRQGSQNHDTFHSVAAVVAVWHLLH